MKKLLAALLALLSLTGCTASSNHSPSSAEKDLQVLCTTYPVYLFTTAVAEGAEGVTVSLLVNSQTSCLHDYTLTVSDMKAIEGADVIVLNGAGLEDFMEDALARSTAPVIDCSAGVALLEPLEEDHGHAHDEGEYDPHIWMDPGHAARMVENIWTGLSRLDPGNDMTYKSNAPQIKGQLEALGAGKSFFYDGVTYHDDGTSEVIPGPSHRELITFHDGFQYFANAFDLTLLKAIEEEEGATASASEIREIVALIEEYDIPAIFTEKNGSAATAEAIAAETGCTVYELDMIMSGDGTGIGPYITAMLSNLLAIQEAFQ